jgi:hypothetical protein
MPRKKDPPALYNIVDEDGGVLATVWESDAEWALRYLGEETGKKLKAEPLRKESK